MPKSEMAHFQERADDGDGQRIEKKPGNRPRRVVSVRFSCEQNSPRSAESLRVAHYLAVMLCPMDRRMGSLACVPAGGATYSIRRIFVSRGKDFGGMH